MRSLKKIKLLRPCLLIDEHSLRFRVHSSGLLYNTFSSGSIFLKKKKGYVSSISIHKQSTETKSMA